MSASERELMIKISAKADSSLDSIGNKVDKAFNTMKKAAMTLGAAGASAITGLTMASVKVGKEYEAQMSTVGAISGASAEEMEQLEEKAREMGATTKFTATESGQAMEYMAMAGWKSEQMIGGIEGIMNLAAASGESLASVSDIVTDALTAFNMTAEDSGHFADVLAKASSNSNTNVAMMGETFKYVASVAGALGYSAEDTAVSIGLMANSGIKASQAGTILRKLMSETAGGIQLVSKAYAKHGEKTGRLKIETANADGSMKDWSETVGRLREEFAKMTEEEQAANAESIGGKTAMAGLLSIVNASAKDYKKLTEQINNAGGATKEMADIRMDNLQGDVQLFQSALEGKGIELYDELKGPLRDLVQSATDWIDGIDVGRAVDDFKELGCAVVSFVDPFLRVGEWMLENPEAIAGPLAGIGSAIMSYKLFDMLGKTGDGIKKFGVSLAANTWMAGGALAVGAVVGIGTAAKITQQKLVDASLDEHFGNISLSMDEIERSADRIVGAGKLESVRKLLESTDVQDGLLNDMQNASDVIDGVEWKISAGIKLDQQDMDSFNKNVKQYVTSAQELIDKKGYTVNVATKVLFGNSADGKELIDENNAFFASLRQSADGLAHDINKILEKSMKDGLTPDLQEALDKSMEELEKISSAKAKASADAKWDVLEADFSGKALDADSFERMQKAVNENIGEVDEGAKEALQVNLENLNWRKELGYISQEEVVQEREQYQKAYGETLEKSRKKAVEFYFNTIMDTYGNEIASGQFDWGDKSAIGDIVSKTKEMLPDSEEKTLIEILDNAFNGSPESNVTDDQTGLSKKEEYQALAGRFAKDYINGKGLSEQAEKVGNETADSLRTSFVNDISKGIDAETTLTISGIYKASFSQGGGPPGEGIDTTAYSKAASKGSGISKESSGGIGKFLAGSVPGHATGIISSREHFAIVSEGNKTEAIIPIDGSERSRKLFEKTGQLMGLLPAGLMGGRMLSGGGKRTKRLKEISGGGKMGGGAETGGNITFSPHITVHVTGGGTKEDGRKIGNEVEKAVEKVCRKMMRDKKRFVM